LRWPQGADAVIDTDPEGWRDRLKTVCGGKGPDVIFDPVCGPLFELAFRSLGWRGRHLVVGFVGGPIPKLPINLSLMKGGSLVGVDVRQFQIFESALAKAHMAELLGWVAEGRLEPADGAGVRTCGLCGGDDLRHVRNRDWQDHHRGHAGRLTLERVKGIEPSYSAWEAAALPLSYTRDSTT
jgi:hypothetical protein